MVKKYLPDGPGLMTLLTVRGLLDRLQDKGHALAHSPGCGQAWCRAGGELAPPAGPADFPVVLLFPKAQGLKTSGVGAAIGQASAWFQ